MKKRIVKKVMRGVVIGAGYFSQYHLDAWSRIPEVRLTAVCDADEEKAKLACQAYGIERQYVKYQDMIEAEQPHFADIITPPAAHLKICSYLAERNISMICQKPLAAELSDAVYIVETVAQSRSRFMVHENWRWQPWHREIRRLLTGGLLGRLFGIHVRARLGDGWREDAYMHTQPYFRKYRRFLVFETGAHFLDLFRYLGGEIHTLYARLARLNPNIQGEDCAHVVCAFQNGATATLDINRYNETLADDPRYTFGTMRVDGSEGHLELNEDGEITVKLLGQEPYKHEYPHSREGFAGDCVYALQRHFTDCMFQRKPFEVPPQDYLKTLDLVEACYLSAEEDTPITIEH